MGKISFRTLFRGPCLPSTFHRPVRGSMVGTLGMASSALTGEHCTLEWPAGPTQKGAAIWDKDVGEKMDEGN